MEPLITIRDLTKIYVMGGEAIYALNKVNMEIYKGEILCVLGTSGSGKSTLLNMLAGLEPPYSGVIQVGTLRLDQMSEEDLTLFRSLNVGFVFQSYNLIPTLSALENVSLGLTFKGVSKKEREQLASHMLRLVGLGDRLHHKPKELSGGQQQRVSIARAFVGQPSIIFADEPTGNLDSKTTLEIIDLITKLSKQNKQTLIMVTHDETLTAYADRSLHMKDGKIDRIVTREDYLLEQEMDKERPKNEEEIISTPDPTSAS